MPLPGELVVVMSAYPAKRRRRARTEGFSLWASPVASVVLRPGEVRPDGVGDYRLTFLLPAAYALIAKPGKQIPCLRTCLLVVGEAGHVTVTGKWRQAVFDQAATFLRQILRDLKRAGNLPPPISIACRLTGPNGEDGWQIIVGADVAFTPCGLEPQFPEAAGAA